MLYRINFQNGQVTDSMTTYAEARKMLESYRGTQWSESYRIERYEGDGEWALIGKAGRLETANREGI